MSGDFTATPSARLFFGIFWKGLVRKSTIWALVIFLHSRTFQKKNMYSQMNCLIEKRILKGKKRKKTGTKKLAYFITGWFYYCEPGVGVLYWGGGLLTPCEHYIYIYTYIYIYMYHTPTTPQGGRGTVLCMTHDHGRGGRGVGTLDHIYGGFVK